MNSTVTHYELDCHSLCKVRRDFQRVLPGQASATVQTHGILGPIKTCTSKYTSKYTSSYSQYDGFSGVIIEGPTGCGKSMLVRRISWECRQFFKTLNIPCADLVNKQVGDSEKRIDEIFALARKLSPTILVLEEIECILGAGESGPGPSGKSLRGNSIVMDRILSSLLINMSGRSTPATSTCDGFPGHAAGPVVVIATTRDIDSLDPSILRPGRLEEHVTIGPLSLQDRKQLIEQCMRAMTRACLVESESLTGLSSKIAHMCEGW